MEFRDTITSVDELRAFMPAPNSGIDKEISYIDEHAAAFIARAPFVLIATSNREGRCDVSPKGDAPGFVQVLDEHTLLLPDRPGNQRADSLRNIIDNPHIGTLFMIPGLDWTLRVNGSASLVRDADVLERCAVNGKAPALGIAIAVQEVFVHCPKCFIRSHLWDSEAWMPKEARPSFAVTLKAHAGMESVPVDKIERAMEKANERLY